MNIYLGDIHSITSPIPELSVVTVFGVIVDLVTVGCVVGFSFDVVC